MKKTTLIAFILTLLTLLASCGGEAASTTTSEEQSNISSSGGEAAITTTSEEQSNTENKEILIPSEGLEFKLNPQGDAYTVTGMGSCTDSVLVIPNSYNNLPVTKIGKEAFYKYQNITSVFIMEGVTTIEYSAFQGCTNLENVSIPESIFNVGVYSFSKCPSLNYNIFDNAEYLGNEANPYLVLFKAINKDITNCEINEKTKVICNDAFNSCDALRKIHIPDSVKAIYDPFYYCSRLSDFKLGNGITYLDLSHFSYNLFSLITTNEYENATYIGSDENPYMALIHADLDAKSVTIHADTKFILDQAFKGSKAESVIFNDNLISIGSSAFFSCYIKEAVLPESLKRIGYNAFDNCHGMKSITIGGEIEEIGNISYAFMYTGITDIYFNGAKEKWEAIVGKNASPLINAYRKEITVHFKN